MANPFKLAYGRIRGMWGVPPIPQIKPFQEMGSGGTPVWGGFVQSKDNNPDWVGQQRWRTSSDLACNVSVVAAGVHYFLNLISQPKWTAQPPDKHKDSEEAKKLADFVNSVMAETTTPWPNIVRHAGVYRFHGFMVQEWIAKKRNDGMIGLADIEVRPQHTIEQWGLDDQGTILACFQRNPQTSELLGLPRKKFWHVAEDLLTDNPEGLGVFRHLAEPFARLKRLQELEVRAYERDLRGIPVARAPLAQLQEAVKNGILTEAQANSMTSAVQAMIETQVKGSDTGLMLDSSPYESTSIGGPLVSQVMKWGFELLSGPGLGLVEIDKAIERLQREMARIMGIDHIMLGDGGGSRAVAQDKSRNIYLVASSVLRMIVASAQKDIVDPLWAINGLDEELKPKLVAEDIAPRDVVEVGTTLARMSQAGAVLAPNDPVINDVRDMLGVSRAKLEDPNSAGANADAMLGANPAAAGLPQLGPDGQPITDAAGSPLMNGAAGKPHISAEAQRLPRNTAANTDPTQQ